MKYKISFYDTINAEFRYCRDIYWNHMVGLMPRAEAFNNIDNPSKHTLLIARLFIKSIKHHYKNRFTKIKIDHVYK